MGIVVPLACLSVQVLPLPCDSGEDRSRRTSAAAAAAARRSAASSSTGAAVRGLWQPSTSLSPRPPSLRGGGGGGGGDGDDDDDGGGGGGGSGEDGDDNGDRGPGPFGAAAAAAAECRRGEVSSDSSYGGGTPWQVGGIGDAESSLGGTGGGGKEGVEEEEEEEEATAAAEGGEERDVCFLLRRRRLRRSKKTPSMPTARRAAAAEPTPMPIAAGVLRPLDARDGCAGVRGCVGMGVVGADVRERMEMSYFFFGGREKGRETEVSWARARSPGIGMVFALTASPVVGAGVGSPDLKRTWMP